MAACLTKLKAQLEVITKCKTCKRKCIQQGSIIEYREVVVQVAAKASAALQLLKKAYSSSN